jgi:hypothetical protein
MLTQGEDVEVHALAARGWSISAIARHIGRDRRRCAADPLEPFFPYIGARFGDDPHMWSTDMGMVQQ